MKIFIPPIGFEFVLSEDWTFSLFYERRNLKFFDVLTKFVFYKNIRNLMYETLIERTVLPTENASLVDGVLVLFNQNFVFAENQLEENICEITLPKGSILKVDRIYIRKGLSEYDSVSFNVKKIPNTKIKSGRFWVKLKDANTIEI